MSINATKHRRVLSSIVIDFVYHGYVPDYFVYKNCVLHTNTLLSLPMLRGLSPGGLCCCIGVTMYGGICRFACIYLCGSRTLILQNGIKLRNITMLVCTFFLTFLVSLLHGESTCFSLSLCNHNVSEMEDCIHTLMFLFASKNLVRALVDCIS